MSLHARTRGRHCRCEALEVRRMLAVQLVADLNPNTLGSEPEEFVSSGSIAYFGARVGGVNSLWKSDGTPAGTVRVRDNLGTSAYPRNIAIVGPKVYFAANADSATGEEPWVSDGTAAGTVPIKDLKQGPGGSEPGEFTAVGDPAAGRAVFYAKGPDGWEPYVTDGTPAGTFQLADINPGPADSLSSAFTRFGQQVIFTANDAAGRGVWKTDGTPGGTVKVASGVGGTSYTEFNGALYFQGSSLSNPNAFVLWRTNGTPAGTVPVLAPDGPPWGIGAFNVSGGSLWFAGSDDPNFTSGDWWRSDGTAAGTVKAIDLPASSRIGTVLQPTWDGHYIFFTWNSDNADNEVWWTDGTTAGSHIIKVFKPLDGSYHVDGGFGFRVFDNHRVMFLARDAEHGKDFWVTDGTPEGTVPLDFVPGPAPGTSTNNLPRRAVWVGDKLVFQAATAAGDAEPYVTDGTPAGTRKLAEINALPAGSIINRPFVRLGGGAIFSADNKLYFTNGTPGNVVPLGDLNVMGEYVGTLPTTPHNSVELNGVAIFAAATPDNSVRRVYRSDGTPAGTYALGSADPSPGSLPTNPQWPGFSTGPFVRAGNYVYFFGSDAAHGMELWRTDGTAAGTQIVKDVFTGTSSGIARQPNIPALGAVGDTVYFKASTDELWKSDGTAAGTQLVKDFGFNNFASDWVQGFVPAGGKLFFEGLNNYPWVSDGTDAGTRELIMRRVVSPIVPFGNGVAFWGLDPLANTIRLYRSDGTPDGTTLLGTPFGTVVVPAGQTEQQAPVVSNGVLYFAGRDDANGMELWKSDGTNAGTVLVSNIRPDKADSNPGQFVSLGGRVYFTADDGTHGRELWSTDGTPGGTRLERDLNPGAASAFAPPTSNISNAPVATADEVLFVAQDDQVGRELFRVPGAPPAGQVVARKLFYNGSAFDGRDISINPADAGAIAPDKAPLLPGQTATSANISSYERGINGLIVDVQGLVAGLHRADFEFAVMRSPATGWVEAPAPLEMETRFSPIPELPARVTFVWADGTLRNAWLRVTVKANANTRLAEPDVFYFGSLPGDTGGADGFTVDGGDVLATRRAVSPAAAAPLTNPFDHNRDGRVSADDLAVVRRNFGGSLPPLAVPIPAQSGAVPPPSRGPVRPRERRWLLAE